MLFGIAYSLNPIRSLAGHGNSANWLSRIEQSFFDARFINLFKVKSFTCIVFSFDKYNVFFAN